MTREAKIGMLTGLMVIVLIGVLLSDYLGGPGKGGAMSPTGRMAELPMGAAYRQEVTEPVGVPGMARGDGAAAPPVPVSMAGGASMGSPTMPEPKATNDGSIPPTGVAGSPIVGQPVTPVPAGQVRMDQPLGDGPTLQLVENTNNGSGTESAGVPGQGSGSAAGSGRKTSLTPDEIAGGRPWAQYVILPGDTLVKIAKKFYGSSKSSNIDLIINSNPKMLKNSGSVLIAGKSLALYSVPSAGLLADGVQTMVPSVKKADSVVGTGVNGKKSLAVVIHAPGSAVAAKATPDGVKSDAPKKAAASAYVVQAGDTLEKIAKRVSPTAVNATVKKIEALNGISDPTALQVGQKLKLPTV